MCPLGMAISVVRAGEQKSEIASQARNDKKTRNPKGGFDRIFYHRERSAMCPLGMAISIV
jgi:hypothetical protein